MHATPLALALLLTGSAALATDVAGSDTAADIGDILARHGKPRALVVEVSATDGRLATLAAGGRHIVHLLARSPADLARIRDDITNADADGHAAAACLPAQPLPYASDLVTALVVRDNDARAPGADIGEWLRVIAPGGLLLMRGDTAAAIRGRMDSAGFGAITPATDGAWTVVAKPRPADIGEWPQYRHDASRAAISDDRRAGACTSLRWVTGEPWAQRAMAQAIWTNGRMFLLVPNDGERLKEPPGFRITALDGWNGCRLWERTWTGALPGVAPYLMAADGERLFLASGEVLSAALGETLRHTGGGRSVTLAEGRVIFGPGKLRAFDAASGAALWEGDVGAYDPLLATQGRLYAKLYGDKSSAERLMACMDAQTGRVLWKAPVEGHLLCWRDGLLLAQGLRPPDSGVNYAYSAEDGRRLWSVEYRLPRHGGKPDAFFMGGRVWVHRAGTAAGPAGAGESWLGLDPSTGQAVDEVPMPRLVKHRCYPHVAAGDTIMAGGMDFFDVPARKVQSFHGARGACGLGFFPANGLVYGMPTLCECFAHVRGYAAFSAEPVPAAIPPDAPGRLRRGSAVPADSAPESAEDWPTFRHDAMRNACTTATAPTAPSAAWSQAPGGSLTPPVVAGGRVFVASSRHRVVALDLATGAPLWSFTADGPVDGPPTVADGLALFGGADGAVYAVSADRGELVWRRQLAPSPRLILSGEQVESAWPVPGAVAVVKGTLYAAAGRHSETDGGIHLYALNAVDGRLRWHRNVTRAHALEQTAPAAIDNEMNDVPACDGQTVYMHLRQFAAADGRDAAPTSLFLWGGTPGYRADVTLPPYGWKHEIQRQRKVKEAGDGKMVAMASLLALDGKRHFGINVDLRRLFCGEGRGRTLWSTNGIPAGCPKALVATADGVWMASEHADGTGALHVFDRASGVRRGTTPMPAAPAFEGLAVVPGRLIVVTRDGRVLCLAESR